ncbi:LysE family transporter [Xanthobacteraceae bacterium Astr-EGSB]|uniref:LysE family translocator n=1 Tax=Astrobacterium formosum TaxID=3069710 RepID=UPI0027B7ACDD|nr:LysE family transporter [Xanthobacteraceae bacterium Astr-EGSB]
MATEFLSLMAVFVIAAITPGADFACVTRESVMFGRRAGILAAIGVGSAIMFHVTYTVLGIGLIVAQSVVAFTIVKWLGAAYLVWLGVQSFRAPAPTALTLEAAQHAARPARRSLAIGAMTNLLNPKATLFFVSLFSTIVSPSTPIAVQFGYGITMSMVLAAWFTIVALFFTTVTMRAAFARIGRWFNRVTGLMLIVLGVRVALQRAG